MVAMTFPKPAESPTILAVHQLEDKGIEFLRDELRFDDGRDAEVIYVLSSCYQPLQTGVSPGYFPFVKVGDWVFLHPDFETESDVIYLNDFRHLLLEDWPAPEHSLTTIAALDSVDLEGKVVADIGCAEGILSFMAVRKGAREVYGVDCLEDWREYFEENAQLNGIGNAYFLTGEIGAEDAVQDLPLSEIEVVVTNLGYNEYDGPTSKLIELLDQMPRVSTFISGGYELDREGLDEIHHVEMLESRGFEGYREFILEIRKNGRESEPLSKAFVMERP